MGLETWGVGLPLEEFVVEGKQRDEFFFPFPENKDKVNSEQA